jgi:hypothetical protein
MLEVLEVHLDDLRRRLVHTGREARPLNPLHAGALRWCLYEAGKTSSRTSAPDHRYYAQVKQRIDGKRAALSQARRIVRQACHTLTALGDDAFATV